MPATERPRGSVARRAFDEARAVIDAFHPPSPATPPAFTFRPPTSVHAELPPDALATDTFRWPDDTIAAASRRVASGQQRCRDLLEASLDAVVEHDPALVALAELTAGTAREAADALDEELSRGHNRGPLHGIPITVKDVIDVAGVPTRAGSDAYFDVPVRDAESVARLRRAGAVVVGKATTHEFALGVTSPQSHNPHDATRIPGGSSGGSAIAVSTGMCLGSLGTDTRASIRVPAALSGTVGLKLTYGRIPTDGVVPLSWTMDHVAPMARTVLDAAIMADVLLGPGCAPLSAWAGVPIDGLRVGVPEDTLEGCEPSVASLVRAAVKVLEGAGCPVVASARPNAGDLAAANAAGLVVSRCEAATFHRSLGADRSLYWEEVAEQLGEADRILAVDYLDAQRLRAGLVEDLLACFDEVDLLAMPTSPVVAPPRDDFARYLTVLSRNAIPWSLIGFPAVSVPCGMADPGLPVGIQLVARPGSEHLLVAAGVALQTLL